MMIEERSESVQRFAFELVRTNQNRASIQAAY